MNKKIFSYGEVFLDIIIELDYNISIGGDRLDDIPGWILAGIALYQLGKSEYLEYQKKRKRKALQRKPGKRKRRKGK